MTAYIKQQFKEQRKHERFKISKFVTLHIGKKSWEVEMRDISVSGFGIYLEGLKNFNDITKTDTSVSIEWEAGELLPARIVWIKGKQAGIMLEEALDHNHPLLKEIEEQIVRA